MNKKEILELYIQDLESKVPESDARNNRIEMLRNELKQVKNIAYEPKTVLIKNCFNIFYLLLCFRFCERAI